MKKKGIPFKTSNNDVWEGVNVMNTVISFIKTYRGLVITIVFIIFMLTYTIIVYYLRRRIEFKCYKKWYKEIWDVSESKVNKIETKAEILNIIRDFYCNEYEGTWI